jgi:hypothetical protein
MPRPERQQNVLDLLKGLRGLEPLKKLFWSELNYQRVNEPLSRRGWPESATKALADDPVLFAGGGDDNAFHVIYCRLASDGLSRGLERPVVPQLMREHPYALFVFSNRGQTDWHFLNVKFDEQADRRQLFRRITVRPGAGLRTATERVQLLDLAEIHPELVGITPLTIQQRCDAAFDVEAVTKDFFSEVANWYFWALKNANFPKDAPKEDDGHDHISIIRLITRLIFCWFVKEKGLIPDTLFDQQKLPQILTGFEPAKVSAKQSVFYKAILQNLFFATLNTEMDKRAWRKDNNNFMAHILYRHRALFQKPNEALELFKNIPFLNGGLFECLDKREGTAESPKDIRIDGFSDRSDSQPTVPDFLFFGGEREVDLSEDYGDNKFKCVPVRGLIHIFNRYNFTVEENTPIEQEVALDPELSGKVFENLLAAYNPETGATARKQTGSFYTPREIVNYMVDESLIACLKTKLETALPSAKNVETRLRRLFAYTDEPHQFIAPEVDALIAAIDSLKTLDPAVGSGAFPMGILHKLVFILGKLDPRNEKWKQRQIQRVQNTINEAEKTEDAPRREKMVSDLEQQIVGINEAFEHNELDYGRKLYLIENCIYGVDIQPIAVQIAKMRFFISLIVDQKIDDSQPNRGVRPLPNLETKFVAASTLIGIKRPGQQLLRNRDIDAKEAELRRVRERHFLARTPKQKARCRDDDARLRAEIAELLKGDGWDTATAVRLASWNPYDQNASADFFDPEWMFGIIDGFHVCIGNPPYITYRGKERVGVSDAEVKLLISLYPNSAEYKVNSYALFTDRSLHLLTTKGVLTFIVPSTILQNEYLQKIRRHILSGYQLAKLVSFGNKVFQAVTDSIIIFVTNTFSPDSFTDAIRQDDLVFNEVAERTKRFLQSQWLRSDGCVINVKVNTEQSSLLDKIENGARRLDEFLEVYVGIVASGIKQFLSTTKQNKQFKKYLQGRHMERFVNAPADLYINFDISRLHSNTDETVYLQPEKLLVRKTGNFLLASYDDEQFYTDQSIYNLYKKPKCELNLKFCLALLNSRVMNYYFQRKMVTNPDVFPYIKGIHLKLLPFRIPSDKTQSAIVKLVSETITAKKKSSDRDTSALEREIDQLVYALYGLTPEEKKIVEDAIA